MGPGTEPALRGPTSSIPPRSIDAMLPPPAPMVCTSIIGRRSGTRKSRSVFSATRGSLQFRDAILVRRIGIRMHERNDDGLDVLLFQHFRELAHFRLVERNHHAAAIVHPLAYFPAAIARNQRLRDALQAVHQRPVAASELEHVAKAARGDQRAARAL